MKVKDTVKSCLLNYPTLFDCRINVFIHLFACIGNGYEWENGELVHLRYKGQEKESFKMKYSDLNEKIKKHKKELESEPEYLHKLTKSWIVEAEFQKQKRKFIAKNIDLISESINVYLKNEYEIYGGYYVENPCYNYAFTFNYPDNITEDWGNAIQEFAKFWRHRMYSKWVGFYREKTEITSFTGQRKKD